MHCEQAILAELERLMEEQFRALQGKLSGAEGREYLERSNTIKALFEELNWGGAHGPRSLPGGIHIEQPTISANNGKNPHERS
jgi:hypothetical protein